MTQEELDKIVEQHQHWIKKDCEGWEDMKADLHGADLHGADLNCADLHGADLNCANLSCANLSCANLSCAKLREADLSRADLHGARLSCADLSCADLNCVNLNCANLRVADLSGVNLSWAKLRGANLRVADLSGANLREADLNGTNLRGVKLREANLSGADLHGAKLSVDDKFRLGQILTEPLTGYKKTKEGVVITAEIPKGSIVFSINGNKCRTNRAKITDMEGHEVLHSSYDNSFEYRLGKEIEIKDFNLMYNVECASGFHFFKTRDEAEEYI